MSRGPTLEELGTKPPTFPPEEQVLLQLNPRYPHAPATLLLLKTKMKAASASKITITGHKTCQSCTEELQESKPPACYHWLWSDLPVDAFRAQAVQLHPGPLWAVSLVFSSGRAQDLIYVLIGTFCAKWPARDTAVKGTHKCRLELPLEWPTQPGRDEVFFF